MLGYAIDCMADHIIEGGQNVETTNVTTLLDPIFHIMFLVYRALEDSFCHNIPTMLKTFVLLYY